MRLTQAAIVAFVALVPPASGAAPLNAQTIQLELARLDGFTLGLTEADRFSGVVLVARGNQVIFEKAYGKIDQAAEPPANSNTRYNLASAGKMFTSVAVLQQVAVGKLSLDTKLSDVLKDYPNHAMGQATIRQLLTHTSGAGDIDLFGVEGAANRARARSVADMVRLHANRSPTFTPGSDQEYGNFAYVLLGRMVEVLSGQTYEEYVAQHVFAPAGMTRTGFVDCASDARDVAVGYATVNGKRVANCATQPNRGLPAGGQISTARDMFLFTKALRTGELIPKSLLAEATKPFLKFMGLGFFATDYGPGHLTEDFRWGHGGSSDGVCTDVRVYPVTGETVIVLANQDPPSCFAVANFLHGHRKKRQQTRT